MLLEMMARVGKNKEFGRGLVFRYKEIRGLENRIFEKRSKELGWFSMAVIKFRGVIRGFNYIH